MHPRTERKEVSGNLTGGTPAPRHRTEPERVARGIALLAGLYRDLARPVQYIASERGKAYEAIGLFDYSTVFYEQAVGFTPSNGSLGSLRNDASRMLRRAHAIVDAPNDFSSDAVALSLALVLKESPPVASDTDRGRYSGLLDAVLKRVRSDPSTLTTRGQVYQYAATGFELLNEREKALQAFEDGLEADPNNEALLVGKGLLLYGTDGEEVEAVFNKAAELGTLRAVPSVLLPSQPLLWAAEPIQSTLATDLVMELTNEQGGGRKSQVQPPKAVWQHYFGIIESDLPQQIDLMNMTAEPAQEEPARPVSLKHHVMTIELAGADCPRPAIVRFRRTGQNKYSYWVYRPDAQPTEFGHYEWLLNNTPNPLRTKGRHWVVI